MLQAQALLGWMQGGNTLQYILYFRTGLGGATELKRGKTSEKYVQNDYSGDVKREKMKHVKQAPFRLYYSVKFLYYSVKFLTSTVDLWPPTRTQMLLATVCLRLHCSLVYAQGVAVQHTDTVSLHSSVPNTEHVHNQNVSAAAHQTQPPPLVGGEHE
jgi:hypothetical protein